MQNQKKFNTIELDNTLDTQKINIYGLFDPKIMVLILICGQILMVIN